MVGGLVLIIMAGSWRNCELSVIGPDQPPLQGSATMLITGMLRESLIYIGRIVQCCAVDGEGPAAPVSELQEGVLTMDWFNIFVEISASSG